jgi:hypothetical protein
LFTGGVLAPGWKVYFYLTGTTTTTPVYTTSALSAAHTQPVVADSAGVMPLIYLDPSIVYKSEVYNENDVLQPDFGADPVNDSVLSQSVIGALLYPRTAAEIAAGVTPTNYAYPPGCFDRFGTNATPGTTDMTDAIQAACDSYQQPFGLPGSTYLVSSQGTISVNATNYSYCVLVPDDCVVDLNGSTVKLANSANASVFASTGTDSAGVINGSINGNRSNQTSPASGEMAGVMLYDVDRPVVKGISAYNIRQYAGRFLNCRDVDFDDLVCLDSYGDGWSFGTSGAVEFRVIGGKIGSVYAQDCEGTFGSLDGNGVIFTVSGVSVQSAHTVDCGGGIKIQNNSERSTFDALIFDGDDQDFGTANSGVKIQGDHANALYPTDISIGKIITRNAYGNGLRATAVNSVSIGSYHGLNNGSGSGASGSDKYDVDLDTTNGAGEKLVQIGSLHVTTPTTVGIRLTGAGVVQVSEWAVRGATGSAFVDAMTGGCIAIGHGKVTDVGSTTTYAFQSTGSARGTVGPIDTNLAHSTSQSRIVIAAANYSLSVGPVRLNGVVLEGIVTLSNAATSTSVSNANVWRDYVGGSADYLHPQISIEPINSSARALGSMYAVVTDGSSGTGFAIKHAAAGASDKVRYRIGQYSVWSEPTA